MAWVCSGIPQPNNSYFFIWATLFWHKVTRSHWYYDFLVNCMDILARSRTKGNRQKQMQENCTWIWGRSSLLCRWQCTRTDWPRKLPSLIPRRYFRKVWVQSWGMCSNSTLLERSHIFRRKYIKISKWNSLCLLE